ncbi:MAG TPA: Ig-like domain-containing protein, partial [Arenimonas sp.]|uniref:Ig-like domain-containing protein n=1 Tax=Arenimonas sp. TaxID=1872635 RepID=UPI002D7FBAF6
IIDAVDDVGTVANGAAGGVAVADVLVNDTLNGAAATLADVSLTQVSTSSPNVTLNPATGAVDVAAGTPAGTYTLVYEICEILNPTNCDTATVTVTVGAAVIDAVDDTGSVASGATGGVAVPDVLVNDTLNGAPASLATVTLTQISTTNPNVTLNPATGEVNVAPGTPAGTYTVVYQLCEILNPTNCDTATVTVTVGAAVIDAVDDTGSVASGASGGVAVADVLVNDTLNGSSATLATVTLAQVSTTNPNVTLNPATGSVDVAPSTLAGTYMVVYQICEILNPTNCDTATVTVTVGAAIIDAVDDTGSVASGATGGVAVPNVLVNDTLNGVPATLATVTLTQVSTTNPNVSLNPATGEVNIAPGTPAGTYTVVYQICEILNPTNCDAATVTVTVGAAVIDAVDDTGSVASGATGGVAVPNVLVNDTLNGSPASLATVTLTQVSTTNPNVTLSPATGAVDVAPVTPAGTYTVVYQICEVLNPTNCDTATVTVTVGAAVIDAVDDTGSVASGATGGVAVADVLVNDTLNGSPATLATVTLTQVSTSNPNVTLNPATGAVEVAAGTPAGTYTLVYDICEILNPTNCDTATVTVTVGAAVIDAVDDTGSVASGATGGVAVADVLVNDTLNGSPATLATVTLAQVSTTNPNVSLNPATGEVNVAPGTPAGKYTVVYQICELLNPTNCDTATVTVTVGAAVIDAVDDTGTVASGATGGVAVPDVLVNDTLNGSPATLATVTLAQVSTTNPNVSLNPATGEVNVAPGTPAGTYTVVYQICEILNPTNCDTATVTVTVGAAVIDAVDDTGTVADGGVGGVAVPDVLANDTLNGVPASLATVVITPLASSHPNVTLDPATGQVTVAPGIPSGSYTVTYRICEILNPANCDEAVVTVTVVTGDLAPVAVDDAFAGDEGAPIPGDAAGNDTPGNISSTYTLVSQPPNGTVAMAPDGSFVYTPNAGFVGPDSFPYQVCDADGDCASAVVTVNVVPLAGKLRLQKVVSAREVSPGALVAYTLTVTNIGDLPVVAADVIDVPPSGFAYVPGSMTVVDADNLAVASGTGPITFAGIDIPVGGTATIRYLLRVGAGLAPGEYVNEATVYQGGIAVSNTAAAAVMAGAGLDPDFEQTRIWGKVFDDVNGDGWQDAGERGIPGVRLATVEGLVTETDAQGRFHIEGLVVSNQMRGQNFVVKVDPSTLPDGAVFTTSNPLMRRITPAVPTRFDFGVRLPPSPQATQVVELELGAVVFAPGSSEIRPQFKAVIEQMVEQLRKHAGGEVSIQTVSGEEALAFDRAVRVRDELLARLGDQAAEGLRVEVLQADQAKLLSVGQSLHIASLLFDTDSDALRAGSEPLIDAIARAVADASCGCGEIVITGRADLRGDAEYNQALSLRRAEAVRRAVEARLAPEQRTRLRVVTEGADAPGVNP